MVAGKRKFSSTTEVLSLGRGVYAFTVQGAAPERVGDDGALLLPAVHIGVGPGVPEDSVEFMSGIRNGAGWIYDRRDVLVIKVNASGTHVVISTLRLPSMPALNVNVEKMDAPGRRPAAAPPPPQIPAAQPVQALPQASSPGVVRLQINIRLEDLRVVSAAQGAWAGLIGQNTGIAGFSILPLEAFPADHLQYKALAADGFETPWTSGGAFCSAQGVGAPLVGFAVRLAKGAEQRFNVSYRGAYRTGHVAGPVSGGAPLQAPVPNSILDAIEVSITPRAGVSPQAQGAPSRTIGPKFSIFRDE